MITLNSARSIAIFVGPVRSLRSASALAQTQVSKNVSLWEKQSKLLFTIIDI